MGVYLAFITPVLSDCSHRACMDSKQSLILSSFLTSSYLHPVAPFPAPSTVQACDFVAYILKKQLRHLKGVNFNSGSLKGFPI